MNGDLPDSIPICGETWSISFCDKLIVKGEALCGICDYDDKLILIANSVKGKRVSRVQKLDTIVHEAAHAIIRPGGEIVERLVTDVANELSLVVYKLKLR